LTGLWGQDSGVDSAEKNLGRKILDFWGIKFTLPISQKLVYGHFRASFFIIGIRFFTMLEKSGVFSRIMESGACAVALGIFGEFMNPFPQKRLFVGLEIPSSCRATLFELDPHLTGLRWLPEEQLHLTLSFLGQVDSSAEVLLRQALAGVRVPPFFLPLRGVGVFNSRGRLSVVWVGVGKGHPHLFALHQRIQDAVIHAGLEPDLKTFHPHITVGRANNISPQTLQPFLRNHADSEFGLVQVTGFALYSSVLSARGATYEVEMRQKF
jgi:2'-5' RNA ligase